MKITSPRVSVLLLAILVGIQFLMWPVAANATNGNSGWSPPVNFSEQPTLLSSFPVLLCDQYQNTHTLWVERNDEKAFVFYRTDREGDWAASTDIIAEPSVNYLRAVLTPDDTVHLLWLTNPAQGDLVYAKAPLAEAGNPQRWQTPVTIAYGVTAGALYADATGVLHVVYGKADETATHHDLLYTRSGDGGTTWSAPTTILSTVTPVAATLSGNIAVDQRGRLHVVWDLRSHEYGVYSKLGYTRSIDDAANWSAPVELASSTTAPGVDVPTVFAFGEDEVHLTWDDPAAPASVVHRRRRNLEPARDNHRARRGFRGDQSIGKG